uniref:NADH dehydrogenase subunit 1 n=1 Tax=Strongyloides stercoralis TaxID=6248 RepID=A0A0K0EKK4_STRER
MLSIAFLYKFLRKKIISLSNFLLLIEKKIIFFIYKSFYKQIDSLIIENLSPPQTSSFYLFIFIIILILFEGIFFN